jgi:hypothetical protein
MKRAFQMRKHLERPAHNGPSQQREHAMDTHHHNNPRRVDLTDRRFGRWTVIAPAERRGKKAMWRCRCDCGASADVETYNLTSGATRSCGCTHVTRNRLSKSREYGIWAKMIRRCHNPTNSNYGFYGGRGVYVCDGWQDFDRFLADMGCAPSPGHSLDRIDTTRGYTCGECDHCKANGAPLNCRWATKAEQSRNQRSNRYYTHDGKTLILKDWARLVGIKYLTLWGRLNSGWSFEDAINAPVYSRYGGQPVKRARHH